MLAGSSWAYAFHSFSLVMGICLSGSKGANIRIWPWEDIDNVFSNNGRKAYSFFADGEIIC